MLDQPGTPQMQHKFERPVIAAPEPLGNMAAPRADHGPDAVY